MSAVYKEELEMTYEIKLPSNLCKSLSRGLEVNKIRQSYHRGQLYVENQFNIIESISTEAEIKSTYEKNRRTNRHDAERHPLCPNMVWEQFGIEHHARNVNT
jgi:hypothetical protein